jgi:hypothetical protein
MLLIILLILLAYTGILGTLLYVLLVLVLVSLLLELLQDMAVYHPLYMYYSHGGYHSLLPVHLDGGTVFLIVILVLVLTRRR